MNRRECVERIARTGIIPVVRAASAAEAILAVEALREGGIDVLEITMTVPGAAHVIEQLTARYGDEVLVGAGTVLDAHTAVRVIQAGARFVVSPSLSFDTIETCLRHSVAIFPGALTPTEVVAAWSKGADAVKIFPCGPVGGAKYLKSLKAPLPQIEMIPTGGVSLDNVSEFIAAGALALGVGADLVDLEAIRAGHQDRVKQAARDFIAAVSAARDKL